MNGKNIRFIAYSAAVLFVLAAQVRSSDFATEVVSSVGPFGGSPYDEPNSVLGKPTTKIYLPSFEIFSCSLVYPACFTDPNGEKLVTTLNSGAEIVVKFDHKVADDAGNPYGIDFIVFGNTMFRSDGWVASDTDMEQYYLESPTDVRPNEPVLISVSQDGNDWYEYTDGPYGDTAFPTNAYAWDRENHCWGEELDWTRPVDPNLTVDDFNGLSAADAIELYDGSAGGTGFDLAESGYEWIQYIKVHGSEVGDIDGFADVSGCGDYKHPYPVGDINKDCKVNMEDFGLLAGHWLDCTWECP